jgi:hypothetical protein
MRGLELAGKMRIRAKQDGEKNMWCAREGREKINGVTMKRRRDRGPKLRCVALRDWRLGSDALQGKTQGGVGVTACKATLRCCCLSFCHWRDDIVD